MTAEPDNPLQPEQGERFPLLDGVRGLAATLVVVSHGVVLAGGIHATGAALAGQAAPSAVVYFFGLSGFVLWRPYAQARWTGSARPSLARYARNRMFRILPVYWVALVALGALLPAEVPGAFGSHAPALFGLAQVYSERTAFLGIGPAWTLNVEAAFYVLMPGLVLAFARLPASANRSRRLVFEVAGLLALGVGSELAAAIVFHYNPRPLAATDTLLGHLDAFAIGMALASISVAARADPARRAPTWLRTSLTHAWLPVVVLMAACAHWLPEALGWGPDETTYQYLAAHFARLVEMAIVVSVAVFALGDGGPVRRTLGSRPLRWLGLRSYSIYIWHWPIISWLHRQELGGLGTAVAPFAALSLVVGVAAGAASYALIEERAWRARGSAGRMAAQSLRSIGALIDRARA